MFGSFSMKRLRRRILPPLLAFTLGIAGAYAMAPVSLWPLLFVALSGFYILYARCCTWQSAMVRGFFFSLGYFLTGLWWVGNALLVEGNEFAWVWPISVIGLPTLLSLFTAGAMAAAFKIAPPPGKVPSFLVFVATLSLAEWLRGSVLSGFPWNLYGYTWGNILPMAQIASLTGSYGLSLLTIFWGALGGFLIAAPLPKQQKAVFALLGVLSIGGLYAYGAMRLRDNPTAYDDEIRLQIVQPNIRQDMKWDPDEIMPNFEKHVFLSEPHDMAKPRMTLVLWPETALPPSLVERDIARQNISAMLSRFPSKAYLLSGLLRREYDEDREKPRYYNSLGIFDAAGAWEPVYNKTHLVPLGEFIPFQEWIPLKPVVEFSGFQPGDGPDNIAYRDIPPFSPLICYEIIFSGDVVDRKAPRPLWIAAITNDAWYGISAGPHQHFMHAIFRSIEEGLPVARSANTGLSGLTDAYGRTLYKTALYEDASIASSLPRPSAAPPLFSRTGNALYLAVSLAIIIGSALRARTFPPLPRRTNNT